MSEVPLLPEDYGIPRGEAWERISQSEERNMFFGHMGDQELWDFLMQITAEHIEEDETPEQRIEAMFYLIADIHREEAEESEREKQRKPNLLIPEPQGEEWDRVLRSQYLRLFGDDPDRLWRRLYRIAHEISNQEGAIQTDPLEYIYIAFRILVKKNQQRMSRLTIDFGNDESTCPEGESVNLTPAEEAQLFREANKYAQKKIATPPKRPRGLPVKICDQIRQILRRIFR